MCAKFHNSRACGCVCRKMHLNHKTEVVRRGLLRRRSCALATVRYRLLSLFGKNDDVSASQDRTGVTFLYPIPVTGRGGP
jgi:hypothetical protein